MVQGTCLNLAHMSTQLVKSDSIHFHKVLTLNWLHTYFIFQIEHKHGSAESGKPPIWTAVISEMLLSRLNISTCSTDPQTKVTDPLSKIYLRTISFYYVNSLNYPTKSKGQ